MRWLILEDDAVKVLEIYRQPILSPIPSQG
jgi:hypothetical protein